MNSDCSMFELRSIRLSAKRSACPKSQCSGLSSDCSYHLVISHRLSAINHRHRPQPFLYRLHTHTPSASHLSLRLYEYVRTPWAWRTLCPQSIDTPARGGAALNLFPRFRLAPPSPRLVHPHPRSSTLTVTTWANDHPDKSPAKFSHLQSGSLEGLGETAPGHHV